MMGDWNLKEQAVLWIGIFATVSTVAWAIAVADIYMPPRSAQEICANSDTARNSAFCMRLAEQPR